MFRSRPSQRRLAGDRLYFPAMFRPRPRILITVLLLILLLPVLAHAAGAAPEPSELDKAREHGWLWAYLSVFGAGVLTSLTPCVYPMIPIVMGIFGARGENVSRGRAVALASSYVGGSFRGDPAPKGVDRNSGQEQAREQEAAAQVEHHGWADVCAHAHQRGDAPAPPLILRR